MSYLLDTNTVIGILRGRKPELLARLAMVPRSSLHTCSVVKAELFYGSQRSAKPRENRAAQQAFLVGLTSHDFDDGAAEHYARIRAEIEASGLPIGSMDYLIASIALAHDLVLVTHNTREFARVSGLQIEDWEPA
ncbi:MAG: type II toxin-antitoxin system VapC family toxin [Polyangiaceae bacterium]